MATVKVPVDGGRISLVSTGKVHMVPVWDQATKRMIEGQQERDADTGMPLWTVDVVIDGDDDARSEAIGVRLPALSAPLVTKWQPVTFEGLVVAVRTNRAGGMTAYWSASGVAGVPAPRRNGGGD
jgi:hypothetical protein